MTTVNTQTYNGRLGDEVRDTRYFGPDRADTVYTTPDNYRVTAVYPNVLDGALTIEIAFVDGSTMTWYDISDYSGHGCGGKIPIETAPSEAIPGVTTAPIQRQLTQKEIDNIKSISAVSGGSAHGHAFFSVYHAQILGGWE